MQAGRGNVPGGTLQQIEKQKYIAKKFIPEF